MAPDSPMLNQLTLVVQDMQATLAFYRKLGLAIDAKAGAEHVEVGLPNGLRLEFDTAGAVHQWDSGWRGETGGSSVLGFSVRSREAVDELYSELIAAGYRAHQQPYDAFWGARYAIVDDPDGNSVGLMSPIEAERRLWPPERPPAIT